MADYLPDPVERVLGGGLAVGRRIRALRINGAKGMALLAFAVVAAAFGVAFLSPWALIPPPPPGLVFLDRLIPLQWWGASWWAASLVLLWGSFREDQSRAMVLFTPLLFVWGVSYAGSAPTLTEPRMQVAFVLQAAIFFALFAACLAVARLVNAPPVDLDALQARVDGASQEGVGDES